MSSNLPPMMPPPNQVGMPHPHMGMMGPPMGGMGPPPQGGMPPPGMMPGFMPPPGAPPMQGMPHPGMMMGMPPPPPQMMGQPPIHMPMMMKPQKQFFPQDIQVYFKERNVGFIKSKLQPKCRSLDPIISHGLWDYILSKFERGPPVPRQKVETIKEKLVREKKEKRDKLKKDIKERMKEWNPFEDTKVSSDPYKTLLITNISYNVNESKLKEHFKVYGPIKSCRIIKNLNQKHRGYGFIEFERKNDFIEAYKNAHEKKIDGRRIGVDIEKGRTILNFKPRRFGGGLGDSRKSKARSVSEDGYDSENSEDERRRKRRARSSSYHSHRSYSPGRRSRSRSNQSRKRSRSRSNERNTRKFSKSVSVQRAKQRSRSLNKKSKSPSVNNKPLRRQSRSPGDAPLRRQDNPPPQRRSRSRDNSRDRNNQVAGSNGNNVKLSKKSRRSRSRSPLVENSLRNNRGYDEPHPIDSERMDKRDKKSKKDIKKSNQNREGGYIPNEEEGEVGGAEEGEWWDKNDGRDRKKKKKKEKKDDKKDEKVSKKEKKSKRDA